MTEHTPTPWHVTNGPAREEDGSLPIFSGADPHGPALGETETSWRRQRQQAARAILAKVRT